MRDLYQDVTDKIIEQLEQGTAPWVRPWTASKGHGGMPYNLSSGRAYRGINVPLLFAPRFASNAWLTFKQAADKGAHVRKGERGSMIVFFKKFEVRDRNAPQGDDKTKSIPLLRSFTVFNTEQIDGLPDVAPVEPVARPTVETAERLMAQAQVRHGGDRAFYAPALDLIQMPQPEQFKSMPEYYATGLHELTHWTGAPGRCPREYGKRFGDSAYAREELVAEMGAAFLCSHCGIDGRLQHASYLASWLKVLKADKRAIVMAAGAAQKAADFVLQVEQHTEEESEEQAA